MAYEQRTESRFDGHPGWRLSHWENGFIKILESGELELVNAQNGGRCEVLVGVIEMRGGLTRIRFKSKAIINDPRMVASAGTFELESDTLHYEMEMQTTTAERLMSHLEMELHRVKWPFAYTRFSIVEP